MTSLSCRTCAEPCINDDCPIDHVSDTPLVCTFCRDYQTFACRQCILIPDAFPSPEEILVR